MQPPIFIVDGADVEVCLTVTEAESAVEPLDVIAGGFTAYDADGTILEFTIEKRRNWFVIDEIVRIDDSVVAQRKPDALRTLLVSDLIARGEDSKPLENATLSELVERLAQIERRWRSKSFFPRLFWPLIKRFVSR